MNRNILYVFLLIMLLKLSLNAADIKKESQNLYLLSGATNHYPLIVSNISEPFNSSVLYSFNTITNELKKIYSIDSPVIFCNDWYKNEKLIMTVSSELEPKKRLYNAAYHIIDYGKKDISIKSFADDWFLIYEYFSTFLFKIPNAGYFTGLPTAHLDKPNWIIGRKFFDLKDYQLPVENIIYKKKSMWSSQLVNNKEKKSIIKLWYSSRALYNILYPIPDERILSTDFIQNKKYSFRVIADNNLFFALYWEGKRKAEGTENAPVYIYNKIAKTDYDIIIPFAQLQFADFNEWLCGLEINRQNTITGKVFVYNMETKESFTFTRDKNMIVLNMSGEIIYFREKKAIYKAKLQNGGITDVVKLIENKAMREVNILFFGND